MAPLLGLGFKSCRRHQMHLGSVGAKAGFVRSGSHASRLILPQLVLRSVQHLRPGPAAYPVGSDKTGLFCGRVLFVLGWLASEHITVFSGLHDAEMFIEDPARECKRASRPWDVCLLVVSGQPDGGTEAQTKGNPRSKFSTFAPQGSSDF
jgi:hypothetical protein